MQGKTKKKEAGGPWIEHIRRIIFVVLIPLIPTIYAFNNWFIKPATPIESAYIGGELLLIYGLLSLLIFRFETWVRVEKIEQLTKEAKQ